MKKVKNLIAIFLVILSVCQGFTQVNSDKNLVAMLDTIYQEDQNYRIQLDEIEKQHGWESDEIKAHWKIINEKDSINLIKVKNIIDERGWLGADVIGQQGNSTLFLVIQHSDLATQEKYLPMMRDAVSKGNANPDNLAYLEDRIALANGKRQIYGSQIGRDPDTGEFFILPLENPDSVDIRRAKVGLSPLATHLENYFDDFQIKWDVEEYKKKLPEIEKKLKR